MADPPDDRLAAKIEHMSRALAAADPVIRRAAVRWYKAEYKRLNGWRIPVPGPESHIWASRLTGRRYVLVESGLDLLAVYRIRPDGALRFLRRWPRWLGNEEPAGPGGR